MQLLREMLLLVEDYGNLKAISPKFLSKLKKNSGLGHTLYPGLGKNSEIEDAPFSSATAFNNTIVSSGNEIRAAVIYRKSDGEQIGFIMFVQDPKFRGDDQWSVMYDLGFTEPSMSQIGEVAVNLEGKDSKTLSTFAKICASSPLIKNASKELGVKFIHVDKERIKDRKERYTRKEGIIPVKMTPAELEKFTEKTAKSLEARLRDFKNSKRNIPLKDLLPQIMEKGYLDTIVIDGYEYKFAQSTINFDAERDENNWMHGKSEVRYEIVDSEKYKKVQYAFWDEVGKISSLRDDEEAYDREKAKLIKRHKLPPGNIYFKLGFKGAALVPVDLRLDYRG